MLNSQVTVLNRSTTRRHLSEYQCVSYSYHPGDRETTTNVKIYVLDGWAVLVVMMRRCVYFVSIFLSSGVFPNFPMCCTVLIVFITGACALSLYKDELYIVCNIFNFILF